jgi:hypothetical protein
MRQKRVSSVSIGALPADKFKRGGDAAALRVK